MKSLRKFNRRVLSLLPTLPRFALMRRSIHLTMNWPDPLEIKLAETPDELEKAYRLLHDAYVTAGYMEPHPTGMRVLPQHLLPQTSTIIAKWGGRIVGTVSLVRDNPFGLPMEKIFDLSSRRQEAQRIAEVSCLAIAPSFRNNINLILFPIFRFAYQYAKNYFGTHEFAIAVNPSMVDLYRGLIMFKKLKADVKSYQLVKGAPAVGMYLNFAQAQVDWKQVYSHRPDTQNLFLYWNREVYHKGNQLPERSYMFSSDPILTPETLQSFFIDRAHIAEQMTFTQISTLLNIYTQDEYYHSFRNALENSLKSKDRAIRWDAQMRANSISDDIAGEIWNVSRTGLCLRMLKGSINPGKRINLSVELKRDYVVDLEIEACWVSSSMQVVGFKIINDAPLAWRQMIQQAHQRNDLSSMVSNGAQRVISSSYR